VPSEQGLFFFSYFLDLTQFGNIASIKSLNIQPMYTPVAMEHVQTKILVHDQRSGESLPNRLEKSSPGVGGLTEENSERIAFVLSCLFAGAINLAELRQWAKKVLEESDAPPSYLRDLVDFNQPLFHIYNVIGFAPRSSTSDEGSIGVSGVAFKRNCQPFDHPKIREEALRKLERNPDIEKRFRSEFPFLNW